MGEIQNFAGGEGESDVAGGETQLDVASRLAGGEGECVSVVTSSGSTNVRNVIGCMMLR